MARIFVGLNKTKEGIRFTFHESCQYAKNPEENEAVSIIKEALNGAYANLALSYGYCELLEGDEIVFATEAREKKQAESWLFQESMETSSSTGSYTNRLYQI